MLTKEAFCKHIYYLIHKRDAIRAVRNITLGHKDVFPVPLDNEFFGGADAHIIELIENAMDLKKDQDGESTLSWWAFDTDYGKAFTIGDMVVSGVLESHMYRKPDLSTPEKLYDFLVWESKYGKKDLK